MKKLLSILLCLVLAAGLLPLTAMPARATNYGDWSYEIDSSGQVIITGYRGPGGDVAIPNRLGGRVTNQIRKNTFYSNTAITGITIPEGVSVIGESAFAYCVMLQIVRLPSTIVEIGNGAFQNCGALVDVVFNGSEPDFRDGVTVGLNNEKLLGAEFRYCAPALEARAEDRRNCLEWTPIYGATYYQLDRRDNGGELWSDWGCLAADLTACSWVDEAVSAGTEYEYRVRAYVDGGWKGYSNDALALAVREWTYEIDGAGVAVVNGYFGVGGDVTIPSEIEGHKIKRIEMYAFYDVPTFVSVTIPEGITGIGESAFENCENLEVVRLPSTLKVIEDGAFCGCDGIREVYYNGSEPTFWENIDVGVSNDNLLYTTIRYLAPALEAYAYGGNNCLEWNTVPGATQYQVYRRDNESGAWCSWTRKATGITFCEWTDTAVTPEKKYEYRVRAYVNGKWMAYSNIVPVTAAAAWEYMVYDGKARITGYTGDAASLTIPAELNGYRVTTIGDDVFSGHSELTAVKFPAGLTEIGSSAFRGCGLRDVTVPEGVWLIESSAFVACPQLERVTLPSTLTAIGIAAFRNCGSLKSITIPEGVTELGDETFYGCASLKSVTIPASVTEIGVSAFLNCAALTDVYFNGTRAQWNAIGKASGNGALTTAALHCIPDAPAVTAAYASGKVTVRWTAASDVMKCSLYRREYTGSWSSWTPLGTALTGASYEDADVVAGREYQYRMKAYNGFWSGYSTPAGVKAATAKPAAPTVTAAYASGKVAVTWTAVSGATKYALYRREYTTSWSSWTALSTTLSGTGYDDSDLTPGREYQYRMKAYKGVWSDYSTPTKSVKVLTKPAAPSFTLSYVDGIMNVWWGTVPGATKYALYRSQYKDGAWSKWTTVNTKITGTSYADEIEDGYKYQYRMKAYKGVWSDFSPTQSVYAVSIRPDAPTMTASYASGKVTVRWSPVAGGIKYAVYRNSYKDGTWTGWKALKTTLNGTSYPDNTVEAGVKYQYRMKAFNGLWSLYSNSVTLTAG